MGRNNADDSTDADESSTSDDGTSPTPGEDLSDRHENLAPAERVVISYPEDLSDWGRFQVEKDAFAAYLRKTKTDRVRQGDAWEEFVGVGCCGSTLDVPLRVEEITGGETLGSDTAVEWTVREACGIRGGWQVQSRGGPNEI
ncbi:hypothetical protein M0R88_04225 [Halorussus gelatinilyticus]|uniref:DUF7968 domain-containing protein n=1 Tax=Halorussus gelatinilyticus TaxID=2937524 RepID=A0A8U0IM81_9EURY|nr:hypothetical protein [Halorussus gelatinilyticus]UPW01314.1 hypothetical protein M0R88_04225 [Halorussus gelatinilyticus]